jgi:hypothetical protein
MAECGYNNYVGMNVPGRVTSQSVAWTLCVLPFSERAMPSCECSPKMYSTATMYLAYSLALL